MAVAAAAGFRVGSGLTAAALARGAGFHFFHVDFGFRAKGRIHERDGQVIPEIGTSLDTTPAGTSPGSESEKIFKNIPETGENIFKSSKTRKAGALQPLMTILVIDAALFIIPEHLICFGSFLEFILGFLIAGIFIGMIR